MTHALKTLLLSCCLCSTPSAWALPNDSKQSMHIAADATTLNYKTGFNTYTGNVTILQGETHLTADQVTTQNNAQRKISIAIAYGKTQLAHYWTKPQTNEPVFSAQARIIKFYPLSQLVVLQGEVLVKQGENSFNGAEIIYDIKQQTVTAPANKQGRATIIIDPAKLST